MAWPAMSDYQDAVQHPGLCFSDADLRAGTAVENTLGLPKPISGNFASVYQIECGRTTYAARCFLRPDSDRSRETRYAKIDRHLQGVGLPYTVDFQYLERGMLVRGEWYPILKMEWLEGDTLDVYVERKRRDSSAVCEVARQFLEMTIDLARCDIAHGDLQHGNILVVDEAIRLIDYDGMYVPGLETLPSDEVGHRNYQDPGRTAANYGPGIDNFSAWVIFLSLLALSMQPSLWDALCAGEECLLFRQEDFTNPQSSAAFQGLSRVGDDQFGELVSAFKDQLASRVREIPPLRGEWADLIKPRAAASPVPVDWVEDHLRGGPATTRVPGVDTSWATGWEWVLDHIEGPSAVGFGLVPTAHRLVLAAVCVASLVVPLVAYGALGEAARAEAALAATLGAPVLVLGVVGVLYRTLPEVKQKAQLSRDIRGLEKDRSRLRADLERLCAERKRLAEKEAKALKDVSREKAKLARSEAEELSRALKSLRERFVENQLARVTLAHARIPGIGSKLTRRLTLAGFRTARDMDWRVTRVHGIGEKRKSDLVAWRQAQEAAIRRRAPSVLPRGEQSKIKSKYRDLRVGVEKRKARLKSEYASRQRRTDAEEVDSRTLLSEVESELGRRECELKAYRGIVFANYVRHLLMLVLGGGAP